MKLTIAIFASCLLFSGLAQTTGPASPAAARKRDMAKTRANILTQLAAAGGDWRAWYDRVRPAWAELNAKVIEAQKDPRSIDVKGAFSWSYLRTDGKPPMFVQTGSANYLMADNIDPDEFIKNRPSAQVLLAFNRFLQQHNVDLIFVPVPKLVEVYPERVLKNSPADRILAPQMQKFILQLLDSDVEVVDLLPEFLKASISGAAPLYLSADSHWAQVTQKLTAKLLAERLARYPFVKSALTQAARFKTAPVEVQFNGADYAYLNPEERKQVEETLKLSLTQIQNSSGQPYEAPDDSPVVMIGDSYVHYFNGIVKGSGIDALLASELNLPVTDRSVGGSSSDSLKEFIRSPELLNVHKVVIWIATSDIFMANDSRWEMLPFPAAGKPTGN